MASQVYPPLITVERFLRIDFGPDLKAELSNGTIRMMAGGTFAHARVQGNVLRLLGNGLTGTGCQPVGSDMGVRTHDLSLRYPDVSVFCGKDGRENDKAVVMDDPRVVVEVLSPSTMAEDLTTKLVEYKAIASVETILYIDHDRETVRHLQRTGPHGWTDDELGEGEDVVLPQFGLTLAHGDIFGRG